MERFLITGASRGLGLAIAEALPSSGDEVWLTSRTQPACLSKDDGVSRHWVSADLRRPSGVETLSCEVGASALDGLIFCAAMWETSDDLIKVNPAEIYDVMALNAAAFIALTCRFSERLSESGNGRVIAIASTAGLGNTPRTRPAYTASKSALRSAVHALREQFRGRPVRFTAISPGSLASDVPWGDGVAAALEAHEGRRIPSADVVSLVKAVFALSAASTVNEIQMPASHDRDC